MSPRMKDQLVVDSFLQAFGKKQPGSGVIIHIYKGSQYTSTKFQSALRKKEARSSMSRKEDPYDNSLMESFYKKIKKELINDAQFRDIDQAQWSYLNSLKLTITRNVYILPPGYQSPRDYEKIPLILLTKYLVFLGNFIFYWLIYREQFVINFDSSLNIFGSANTNCRRTK